MIRGSVPRRALAQPNLCAATPSFYFVNVAPPARSPPRASDCAGHFEAYKKEHSKAYASPKEHAHRMAVFCGNLKEIEEINSHPATTWRVRSLQLCKVVHGLLRVAIDILTGLPPVINFLNTLGGSKCPLGHDGRGIHGCLYHGE